MPSCGPARPCICNVSIRRCYGSLERMRSRRDSPRQRAVSALLVVDHWPGIPILLCRLPCPASVRVVHLFVREVTQLGHPVADVVALLVELFALQQRVENAEIRLGIDASACENVGIRMFCTVNSGSQWQPLQQPAFQETHWKKIPICNTGSTRISCKHTSGNPGSNIPSVIRSVSPISRLSLHLTVGVTSRTYAKSPSIRFSMNHRSPMRQSSKRSLDRNDATIMRHRLWMYL